MAVRAPSRALAVLPLPAVKTLRSRHLRTLNIATNLTLCTLLAVSFATGWIASYLGLSEFGLHKYSSIAVFAFAFAHLLLHASTLKAQIRRLFQ